ncbi:MAG TPA: hypothetical protein VNF47_05320 [Streptosporangiaceae bacterium]|nr:hypothetical protein [Streptosporangiaceae bacterium]
MTIIIATHDAEFAAAAGHIIRLIDGQITEDPQAAPVFDAPGGTTGSGPS